MSTQTNTLSGCAPPLAATRGAIRWISTNNPFYVLSAGLFLAGLWISFRDQGTAQDIQPGETWALMSWLAGYTLLLAGTAYLLVRFARIWDDARTVLLLVVLMFLATSVTFDDLLVQNPSRGVACNLMGLGFALAVSEGLLRGIGLLLPGWYRAAYYLLLSLFFLYPIALTPLVHEPTHELQMWGVFGFTTVAGLVFLLLVPAIRRGAAYVQGNGSPWPWPLYPWALFGLLALAVPARAFLLCWSMHLVEGGPWGQLLFEPFFLVPFCLVGAVLLLETGMVSGRVALRLSALAMPIGLIVLATVGHRFEPINERFLRLFTDRLGGAPVFLTLCAATAFYGYATIRGVRWAAGMLAATLMCLGVVEPANPYLDHFVAPDPVYLLVVMTMLIGYGLLWRDWPALIVAGMVLTCWLTVAGWHGYRLLRHMIVGLDYIALSLAVFVLAVGVSLGKSGLLHRWLQARRKQAPG